MVVKSAGRPTLQRVFAAGEPVALAFQLAHTERDGALRSYRCPRPDARQRGRANGNEGAQGASRTTTSPPACLASRAGMWQQSRPVMADMPSGERFLLTVIETVGGHVRRRSSKNMCIRRRVRSQHPDYSRVVTKWRGIARPRINSHDGASIKLKWESSSHDAASMQPLHRGRTPPRLTTTCGRESTVLTPK